MERGPGGEVKRLAAVIALLLLAACQPDGPPQPLVATPPPARQLATVVLTATTAPTEPPTLLPATPLSPSPPAPQATVAATPTPNVGIFMGDGSAPLVLPTNDQGLPPAAVQVTLAAATPIPLAAADSRFPTATFSFVITSTPGPGVVPGVVPGLVDGGSGSAGSCAIPVNPAFERAYLASSGISSNLGCPVAPATTPQMAQQEFERGTMFWRDASVAGDSGDIYALAGTNGTGTSRLYWRVRDTWDASQPEDDPSLVPPSAGVQQPRRGFGLAWRNNTQVRSALGWALADEVGYSGAWQEFERGALFSGADGAVYALLPALAPPDTGQFLGPIR